MFRSESIEYLIEVQAFSPSYNLAPPSPPSHLSKLSLFLSFPVYRRSSLLSEEVVWQISEKALSSVIIIQYSLV
jgi:hypothetical protein